MKVLETDSLILRTFTQDDIAPMIAINLDERVMEYFPSVCNEDATRALVEHICAHHAQYGFSLYAVEHKLSNEFIGFVGLNIPSFDIPKFEPLGQPIVEIGWRLASSHWGRGYATQGAKAVLEYAFNELKLPEIISFTAQVNLPSRRVMEKIGLHHHVEDDFDHPKLAKDSWLKRHVLYRLTLDDYAKDTA